MTRCALITGVCIVAAVVAAPGSTAIAQSQRFPDVPDDHYAHGAIEWAADAGVTVGYTDGTFKPQRPLIRRHAVVFMERYYDEILGAEESDDFTRGDMMVLLKAINDGTLRGEGPPDRQAPGGPAASQRFPDVPDDHYAHGAVEWAADAGVTVGYTDGTFKPQRPLIRRHAVVFMERYYDEILGAEESDDFTRGDMMVLLKAINDGTLRDAGHRAENSDDQGAASTTSGDQTEDDCDSELPGLPRNVEMDWVEGHSLTVRWQEPVNGGPADYYHIDRTIAGEHFPPINGRTSYEYSRHMLRRSFSTRVIESASNSIGEGLGHYGYVLYHDDAQNDQRFGQRPRALDGTSAVRVVAFNCAGFAVSGAVAVPSKRSVEHNELSSFVKSMVDSNGDAVPWIREVWDYITDRQRSSTSFYFNDETYTNPFEWNRFSFVRDGLYRFGERITAGYALVGLECPEGAERLCATVGEGIAVAVGVHSHALPRRTSVSAHELAHIYTLSSDAPSNPMAVAAGHLYLQNFLMSDRHWTLDKLWGRHDFFRCTASELFASLGQMLVEDQEGIPRGLGYWRGCGYHDRPLSAETVSIARSALGGQVPQWFYDTYRSIDGSSYDLDSLWADIASTDSSASSFLLYSLRNQFGGYCSDDYTELWKYRNPWREGGCKRERADLPDDRPASVTLAVGSSANGQPGCSSEHCRHLSIALDARMGYYDVECWSGGSHEPWFSGQWHWPASPLWAEGGCWHGHPGGESVWVVVDGVKSNEVTWGQTESVAAQFTAVAVGFATSCGISTDQSLKCWGLQTSAQDNVNVPPSGAFSAVSFDSFGCGIRIDRTVECWGYDTSGETAAPAGEFNAVSAGYNHACGIRSDSTVECWGKDDVGQSTAPSGTFSAVSAGRNLSCGIRANRSITCWGPNGFGQANAPAGQFTAVSTGEVYSCGIRTDRAIVCWGAHGGHGGEEPPDGAFIAVSVGGNHVCAIRANSTITCWGDNQYHQASPPGGRYTAVRLGWYHTCALRTDGTIECWGADWNGRTNVPSRP